MLNEQGFKIYYGAMLGRHHFLLSTLTALVLIVPVLPEYPEIGFLVLVGVGIGSLIPDVDGEDATIFHRNIRGISNQQISNLVNVFANLFPLFGYTTKYLIYKPSRVFYDRILFRNYDFQAHHRGYMHSILGIFTTTSITGLILFAGLYFLEFFNFVYLLVFLTSYLFGAFLHLMQDSCTRTGIVWNQPFHKWKIKGNLVTSSKSKHTVPENLFTLVLVISISILLAFLPIYSSNILKLHLFTIILASLYWAFFLIFVAKVEIKK